MSNDMINNPDNPAFRTTVGPRGRVTLTSAVRAAAGLSEGDQVVVRAVAPGVVVVESREAFRAGVVDRIRAGNPETLERLDAVEDVQEARGR